MENLYETLVALSAWCARQPGAVTWLLMSTIDNGRRGFQIVISNHSNLGSGDLVLAHFNASNLAQVAEEIRAWVLAKART